MKKNYFFIPQDTPIIHLQVILKGNPQNPQNLQKLHQKNDKKRKNLVKKAKKKKRNPKPKQTRKDKKPTPNPAIHAIFLDIKKHLIAYSMMD